MKTLLQINTVVNSGSTGRIAEEIGQTAIKNGWKSYIAYGRNEQTSKSDLIKIGNDWDIKIHGLQTRLFDRHGLASKTATKELVKKIDIIKPDIIHLHNLHGYYLNFEILFNYLKDAEIPVVWTLHDCWPLTGHCVHFDYIGCDKWKTKCYKCPQKNSYPASYLMDRSDDNYLLKKELFNSIENLILVPVSEWLANLVKVSFLKNKTVNVIHNGVNTEIFQPVQPISFFAKYKLKNKKIVLGVASVWSLRKGLNDFIELSHILDSRYQIVLVGLSLKQIKHLPKNILGIQRTESVNELAELYSISDVFVNPTYEDNFPTTNLESLACGTPVITYNTGGSPEAIDKNTGIVVEKGNIKMLEQAILKITKNDKVNYTADCINRISTFFNKDDRFQDYLELYEQLL